MVFDGGSHVLEREGRDETDAPPARDRSTGPDAVILALHQIGKTFAGVVALADVSFDLRRGEVHAVCGENGAGKSTLMKIISGVYTPTTGRILYKGVERHFSSPLQAEKAGIAMIHQELNLVPHLSGAENIYLAREPRRGFLIDRAKLRADARRCLDLTGILDRAD